MNNITLNRQKYSTEDTDSWYTPYEYVEEECDYYTSQFYDKKILCNCDDPIESNFTQYFIRNFHNLQLKELVCTAYYPSHIQETQMIDPDRLPLKISDKLTKGYVLRVTPKLFGLSGQLSYEVNELGGHGDFLSGECIQLLKDCDIVVTNPPFSGFRQLFEEIQRYHKQYLLVANQNCITYRSIFSSIMNNQARVGYRFGNMRFRVPNDTVPRQSRFWIDSSGQKWRSLGNSIWLTNLSVDNSFRRLQLIKSYNPNDYPKYDGQDVIHVQSVRDIPGDYLGKMAVPITYLKYHNGRQFEIVGKADHGSSLDEYDLFKPILNGVERFKRLVIRRKS